MTAPELRARDPAFLATLNIRDSGQGEVPVVLANGFGTDQSFWNQIMPWLDQRFRVIRFDWIIDPRHYDSDRYSRVDGFADDLLAVLLALNLPPCLYVGHSMAGMVGMLAAKRAPDRFRAMVMLAPSPCYTNHPGYQGGFESEQIEGLLHALAEDYLAWVASFSPQAMAAPADGPEVAEFTRALTAMRPDVAFAMALTVFKMDLRDRLDGFAIPTTIVQTRDDIAVPVAVAEYLCARWPQARLEMIETSGHFPHLTAPAQLISILARCLLPA